MRSTRSKNQKRKRGSKSRRRLRQRGGIWGSLKTVAGHGANFTRRVFAGVKSRARAALNRHEPFDQNVALPVVRTKGLTYRLVKVSSNDYMWEIKGWDSSEPEKSFRVPTGWILQMPAKGEEPYLLIPLSEWNREYNLSNLEDKDPHLIGQVYVKNDLAKHMGEYYPIFTPKPPEPIANFEEYLFSQTIGGDENEIITYALRLPISYWWSHLPVPKSMPEEEATKIRKEAEEAAKFFATTDNYLATVSRYKPFDENVELPLLTTNGVTYNLMTISIYYNDYMWEIKGWDSSDQKKSFLVPTGWILQMPAEGVKPYLLIPPSEWNYKYNLSTEKDPHFDEKGVKNGNVYDKTALAMAMGNVYDIFTPKPPEPIANFDEYLFKKTIVKDVRINIYALALPSRYWGSHLPVPKSMPEEEAKRIRKQAEEAANILSRKIS